MGIPSVCLTMISNLIFKDRLSDYDHLYSKPLYTSSYMQSLQSETEGKVFLLFKDEDVSMWLLITVSLNILNTLSTVAEC